MYTRYQRIPRMFTTLNLAFLLIFKHLPPALQDVVRATSLLIVFMVSTVWLSGRITHIYTELFNSFANDNMFSYSPLSKIIAVGSADFLCHVLPCIIIGLPHHSISLLIAYAILLLWFYIYQNHIGDIYAKSITKMAVKRSLVLTGMMVVGYLCMM